MQNCLWETWQANRWGKKNPHGLKTCASWQGLVGRAFLYTPPEDAEPAPSHPVQDAGWTLRSSFSRQINPWASWKTQPLGSLRAPPPPCSFPQTLPLLTCHVQEDNISSDKNTTNFTFFPAEHNTGEELCLLPGAWAAPCPKYPARGRPAGCYHYFLYSASRDWENTEPIPVRVRVGVGAKSTS